MQARRLILGSAFEPDALKMLGEAFDEAWASIASSYGEDASAIEAARLRLAGIMIELARDRQLGPDQLKRTALRLFAESRVGGLP
jgi:hypothetical protein